MVSILNTCYVVSSDPHSQQLSLHSTQFSSLKEKLPYNVAESDIFYCQTQPYPEYLYKKTVDPADTASLPDPDPAEGLDRWQTGDAELVSSGRLTGQALSSSSVSSWNCTCGTSRRQTKKKMKNEIIHLIIGLVYCSVTTSRRPVSVVW